MANQGHSQKNGAITVKNMGDLIVRAKIQYQFNNSVYERSSDPLSLNQEYTFLIPIGSSGVFIKIQTVNSISSKYIYENVFQSFENVCIKVTGTIYQAFVSNC